MRIFSKSRLKDTKLTLFIILLLAAFFRFYGLNWDQNQHLHPDERFLTMVTGAISWPKSLSQYFDPQISPLNPYNNNFGFFVYGTLPLVLVKAIAELIKFNQFAYHNFTLVGRFVSALFDLGIVFFVFKIGQKIFDEKTGLLASFFYAIAVLPIQLSHFFAVDTFLVFFLVLSFYLLTLFMIHYSLFISALLGASFGLALACKLAALLFLPIIILGYFLILFKKRSLKLFIIHYSSFIILSYLFLRLADPRIFTTSNFLNPTPNPQFVANLKQFQLSSKPDSGFPPSLQWIKTKPIIFPLKNLVLWGLGLPLGIVTIGGVIYFLFTRRKLSHFLILFWTLPLFLYQGVQFSKPMRYFYPLYPFLAILAANFSQKFIFRKMKNKFLLFTFYFLLLIYPLSFISIYSRPHSRVAASQWIYENIPSGSTISCEHWDDCLPLPLGNKSGNIYQTEMLHLYDPDTEEKWQKINQQLKKIDYLIMSSNRLWGSIPKVPEKYPLTAQFYQDLFAEKLNFKKVAELTSYPTIPILKIQIPDASADESFTVYDHPKVLIFKRKNY